MRTEREAKHFLADHTLPVTRETFAAATAAEAVAVADAIGYPVVLKIESPDLPHKTETGGIRPICATTRPCGRRLRL